MNPASDSHSPPPGGDAPPRSNSTSAAPSNWREAIPALVSSRIALIQLEARDAARLGARRAAALIAAMLLMFFAWALLLAGGIAIAADQTGWPWHWIALSAAVLHLLVALILLQSAKTPTSAPFPVTRAEFQKDREWIESLRQTPKSST